ncbi:MAG TPA: hypothetical protein VM784_04000 [Actinomycetota bacterium]|nr:hypothetical protein [Actinomycetota bacterium]
MKIHARTIAAAAAFALVLSGAALARPASAPLKGEGENLDIVANVEYQGGTDMEFATIKGRDYAFAGSAPGVGGAAAGALHVIDVTTPTKPKEVATLNCSLYQADIQLSHDKKTLIMSQDGGAAAPNGCLMAGKSGFMTIDIKNPKKPKPLGVAEIPRGAHNTTAHPKKPYVYNSDSDLANVGEIQIWSIKNPKKPELVKTIRSLPHSPHDISFNKDGSRAVTAARSHFDIFDTSDPENPTLVFTHQCPGCYITHDAKFTPDGKYVIIGDEANGGGGYPCPGGALYFYELAGNAAVLRGTYEPGELVFAREGQTALGACTSHVFDISKDSSKIAISWYTAGTRYLDISNPTGVTFGDRTTGGVRELGWFMPDGGSSWSSKFYKGPYIYSNDINRGFDVFRITAEG